MVALPPDSGTEATSPEGFASFAGVSPSCFVMERMERTSPHSPQLSRGGTFVLTAGCANAPAAATRKTSTAVFFKILLRIWRDSRTLPSPLRDSFIRV